MRPDDKLRVRLDPVLDRNRKTYYLGKLKFPGMLDCTNGIVFLVYTSEEGAEEIQIAEYAPKEKARPYSDPQATPQPTTVAYRGGRDPDDDRDR